MSRYNKRRPAINKNEQYENIFNKKGVKNIEQYRTLSKDVYEEEVYDSIEYINHTWKHGDMYWRLSSRYYGDPQYWWVIASFNKRPTEHLNKLGDILKIPTSLADAIQIAE